MWCTTHFVILNRLDVDQQQCDGSTDRITIAIALKSQQWYYLHSTLTFRQYGGLALGNSTFCGFCSFNWLKLQFLKLQFFTFTLYCILRFIFIFYILQLFIFYMFYSRNIIFHLHRSHRVTGFALNFVQHLWQFFVTFITGLWFCMGSNTQLLELEIIDSNQFGRWIDLNRFRKVNRIEFPSSSNLIV